MPRSSSPSSSSSEEESSTEPDSSSEEDSSTEPDSSSEEDSSTEPDSSSEETSELEEPIPLRNQPVAALTRFSDVSLALSSVNHGQVNIDVSGGDRASTNNNSTTSPATQLVHFFPASRDAGGHLNGLQPRKLHGTRSRRRRRFRTVRRWLRAARQVLRGSTVPDESYYVVVPSSRRLLATHTMPPLASPQTIAAVPRHTSYSADTSHQGHVAIIATATPPPPCTPDQDQGCPHRFVGPGGGDVICPATPPPTWSASGSVASSD
ncbi:hypothetical protein E8E14_001443 [Neopestalotiopsis sp. 37M]|nr:hypothetical protein E8E14_001443 [Neopestalotiopsis sp. 37M]